MWRKLQLQNLVLEHIKKKLAEFLYKGRKRDKFKPTIQLSINFWKLATANSFGQITSLENLNVYYTGPISEALWSH